MTEVTKTKDISTKSAFLVYFVVESFTDPLHNQLVPAQKFGPNVLYPNCFHGIIQSLNKFLLLPVTLPLAI